MTQERAALAAATHQDCLDDWAARPPGSAITQHGVDAHAGPAALRLDRLNAAGWSLVSGEELERLRRLDGTQKRGRAKWRERNPEAVRRMSRESMARLRARRRAALAVTADSRETP